MNTKSLIISVLVLIMFAGAAYAVSNYGRNASIEGLGSAGAVVYVVDTTGLLGQDVANLTYHPANQTLVVKFLKGSVFYDLDNTSYYIDPANTGTSGLFAGSIGILSTNTTPSASFFGAGKILHLQGNNNNAAVVLERTGTGASKWEFGVDDAGNFGIVDGSNDPANRRLTLKPGYIGVGTASFPSGGGTPVFVMAQAGSAPTGLGSNTAGIYVLDVSGTAELFTIDEGGTSTQQTSHPSDFLNTLPNDENHTFPWVYTASNPYLGKKVTVDEEAAFRALEVLTGKQFVYVENITKTSWADTENHREREENNKSRDAAVQSWLRNASEIEVLPSAAFEFVWDNKTVVTGKIIDYKNEYSFDENGAVSASVVPIYETKTISKEKRVLKNDVRFDKAVGKFYRKPTKAEAEVAVGEGYSHYLKQSPPAWMANRGAS